MTVELDRWADDGGPVNDGGPGFPALRLTLALEVDFTPWNAAMRGAFEAFGRIAESLNRCADLAILTWDMYGNPTVERRVERARRQRIERAMRTRARRAARHGRALH